MNRGRGKENRPTECAAPSGVVGGKLDLPPFPARGYRLSLFPGCAADSGDELSQSRTGEATKIEL